MKFVPVQVSVNALVPAVRDVGDIDDRVGTGFRIEKVDEAVEPPPGAGFSAVTETKPALRRNGELTAAVRVVEFTYVVGSGVPFQRTTAPLTKPDPLNVRVKGGLFARIVVGEIELPVGTGLGVGSTLTVNGIADGIVP